MQISLLQQLEAMHERLASAELAMKALNAQVADAQERTRASERKVAVSAARKRGAQGWHMSLLCVLWMT
jgi:hypothetical protein